MLKEQHKLLEMKRQLLSKELHYFAKICVLTPPVQIQQDHMSSLETCSHQAQIPTTLKSKAVNHPAC